MPAELPAEPPSTAAPPPGPDGSPSPGRRRHETVVLGRRHPLIRAAHAVLDPGVRLAGRLGPRCSALARRARLAAGHLPAQRRRPGRERELAAALRRLPTAPPRPADVLVLRPGADGSVGALLERGAGDEGLVCLLPDTSRPLERAWLARLASELGDDAVAATPLLVQDDDPQGSRTALDLRVRALGIDLHEQAAGVPVARYRHAGERVDPSLPAGDVAAPAAGAVLVERRALGAVVGAPWPDEPEAAMVELGCRLRERGWRIRAVPSSVVADRRPAPWRGSSGVGSAEAWSSLLERRGPQLLATARGASSGWPAGSRRSFVLTIGARRTWRGTPRWGDWHLAEALARSLDRRGHDVRVQTVDEVTAPSSRTSDVHVVLRGATRVERASGQIHVLWIISHPDSITMEECHEADLVLVASERFARHLRTRTRTPVEVMLQATDHRRFRPGDDRRPPPTRHAVGVVANTRHVFRPVVADALAAGLRPAVYGRGWERFVDPDLVVARHVDNEDLPALYASMDVLLNDHWDDMRAWGFVSNRLFDALACGTPVVSDHLDEIEDLFGDAVATYAEPAELRAQVDRLRADARTTRRLVEAGRRIVLDRHTFDHRAAALEAAVLDVGRRSGVRPTDRSSAAGETPPRSA